MDLVKFLKDLTAQGVELWIENDDLNYIDPDEILDKEVLLKIKENKNDILELLKESKDIYTTYPLSYNQRSLWIIYQTTPENITYNIGYAVRIKSSVSVPALKKAFQNLVSRHATLRTVYSVKNGTPVQNIMGYQEVNIEERDVSLQDKKELTKTVQNAIFEPFDIELGPVFRVNLFTASEGGDVLLVCAHHISIDGWSLWMMMDEVLRVLYPAEKNRTEITLPPLGTTYIDYVFWQDEMLASNKGEKLWKYWESQLAGEMPIINLPIDKPRSSTQAHQEGLRFFYIPEKLNSQLRTLAKTESVTLFTVLLTSFRLLLHRYTNQDEVLIGTPTMGRDELEFNDVVGYFVNPVTLKSYFNGTQSFRDFMKQTQQTILEAIEFQEYPFQLLVEKLNPERNLSHSPIYQVMFLLHNSQKFKDIIGLIDPYQDNNNVMFGDLVLENFKISQCQMQFDLTMELVDCNDSIFGMLHYNSTIFEEETILRVLEHLENLLNEIVNTPGKLIGFFNFLSDSEEMRLLHEFNNTKTDCPNDKTIQVLFEEQVERTPNCIAIVFEDKELTYRQLNNEANRLGHYLKSQYKVVPDDLVGVLLGRTEYMIVALLGILKSGGAYVPIDPEYPNERIRFMLDDCDCKVLISEQEHMAKLKNYVGDIVDIRGDFKDEITNVYTKIKPNDLAYVIYTSGSTGKPKGVSIEHKNVAMFINWCIDEFKDDDFETVFAVTSICFDLSVFEIFYTLSVGKKIKILKSGLEMEKHFNSEKNILINTVPSNIKELLKKNTLFNNVVSLNMAGEPISISILNNLKDLGINVRNLYGPSEDTTYTTCYKFINYAQVFIGKPIANTQIYIVDKNLNITAIGVPGEICISGVGIARGYLNRPELTNDKFLINSFIPGERLYRTGDLGRWRSDGNIEYLGRIDDQVKIRGYRIECGEIEWVLDQNPLINDAVVIARENKIKEMELIAYIVCCENVTIESIREHLLEKVPDYMIPALFVKLEKLPLTPNGKIDKKGLPDPKGFMVSLGTKYVAPINNIEKELTVIWEEFFNIKKIGTKDNFFNLGGHSLKAIRIISRIQDKLQVDIKLRTFFINPTISSLAKIITGLDKSVITFIPTVSEADYYPLSHAQRRLWALDKFEKKSIAYNIPISFMLDGVFNMDVFKEAFSYLVKRHEILRSRFITIDEKPVQEVGDVGSCIIEINDLCDRFNVEKLTKKEVFKHTHISFDLEKGELIRIKILKLNKNRYVFLLNIHHIICDGWSIPIILNELSFLYTAIINGEEPLLPKLQIQYRDYTAWHNDIITSDEVKSYKQYWHNQFTDKVRVLDLPADFSRPLVQSFEGDRIEFVIPKNDSNSLKLLIKDQGVSLFMGLLAIVKVLLSRYTSQEDIIVGTPVVGRQHKDLENQIGFYVNTLALRDNVKGGNSFIDLLIKIKETVTNGFDNQVYPFDILVEELDLKRDMSRSPLFDVMVVLQDSEDFEFQLPGIKVSLMELDYHISKFDLTFGFIENRGEISCMIEYNTSLYKRDRIERLISHFKTLLKCLVSKPEGVLDSFDILPTSEKHQLLYGFNNTKTNYPKNKTISALFEEQVEKTPNSIAVVFNEVTLTYKELNEEANKLAFCLMNEYGVSQDDLVGILLNRSEYMIVALLGILKSGGAYVPIDPEYPGERIGYMIQDCNCKVLVSEHMFMGKLKGHMENVVDLKGVKGVKVTNPIQKTGADSLAYVIYTSGSTGFPKGVMIEQRSVVRLVKNSNYIQINESDRILQTGSFSFDASTFEIWGALLNGACLCLLPEGQLIDVDKFGKSIKDLDITILWLTSSLFNQIVGKNETLFSNLDHLLIGGEKLSVSHVNMLRRANNDIEIINGYGPTENTTFTCTYKINRVFESDIPLGKPISNTRVYIIDKSNNLSPIGVPGELCLAGDGLARGYLGQPELTLEKFIDNPFIHGESLYRTGDLCKWLPDGNIEFLGRIDDQVKIRGYRIECGEIEYSLIQHASIDEAFVIAKKSDVGEKELVAYIVCNKDVTVGLIREYLSSKLPDYMIPAHFVELDTLPLTPNGKVDKKALPEPEGFGLALGTEYITPHNELEKRIALIWEELLGKERVGVNDNFFELGGDSIKAIQVVSRLFNYNLHAEVKQLFQKQTITKFAPTLRPVKGDLCQDVVTGKIALTPIQKYFFEEIACPFNYFHQTMLLLSKERIDEKALRRTLQKVMEHHDALRMRFAIKANQVVQENVEHMDFDLKIFDLKESNVPLLRLKEETEVLLSGFKIENGGLFKAAVFSMADADRVFLAIHHLVVDGVSWRILMEDIERGYEQAVSGNEVSFPLKTSSFKDWSEALDRYSKSNELFKEKDYWCELIKRAKLAKAIPKLEFNGKALFKESKTFDICLTREETEMVLQYSLKAYNTRVNDILVTALCNAVYRWKGVDKLLIDLESHGRLEGVGVDTVRTVGWFTAMFPLFIDTSGYSRLADQIKCVKELLHKIPNDGTGYGIFKYLAPLDCRDGLSFDFKPDICFNYLGCFDDSTGEGFFSFANEETASVVSGDAELTHGLMINAITMNGVLKIPVTFHPCLYKPEDVEFFLSIYKGALLEIANHCINKVDSEHTPADFDVDCLSLVELDKLVKGLGVRSNEIANVYELSPMQEGMLFHYLFDTGSSVYFELVTYCIRGGVDVDLLKRSWNVIFERHDILRTVFVHDGVNRPLQVVFKSREIDFVFEDISGLTRAGQDVHFNKRKDEDKSRLFDLSKDVLMRVAVLKCADDEHRIIWSFHHIIIDGWCIGIIYRELFEIYSAMKKGTPPKLATPVPYKDYIFALGKKDKDESLLFWKNYLTDYESVALLPEKHNEDGNGEKGDVEEHVFKLTTEQTARLKGVATRYRVTLNIVVQAIWGILLRRYNNCDDTVFGATVSGRSEDLPGVENIVGLFINTIPVRGKIEENKSFVDLLCLMQREALECKKHHHFPLTGIQTASGFQDGLFNHIMVFENYPIDKNIVGEGVDSPFNMDGFEAIEQTNYDFSVIVVPWDELMFRFSYKLHLFDAKIAQSIEGHFRTIIDEVIANPETKIANINILTKAEQQQVVYEFNDTCVNYNNDKSVITLFEEQVERTPDNIAVVFEDMKSTYKHLNEDVNQLANCLMDQYKVQPNDFVVVLLDRSEFMLVALLAVLKAGGTYVPIDPDYPDDRIQFIVCDCMCNILITNGKNITRLNYYKNVLIDINDISCGDYSNPVYNFSLSHFAYIIYTSGSTGNPKGVLNTHQCLKNLMLWQRDKEIVKLGLNSTTFASIGFDVSIQEMLFGVLSGGCLHVIPSELRYDYVKLRNYVVRNNIELMTLPFSALNFFFSEVAKPKKLNHVITSGEQLEITESISKLLTNNKDLKLFNQYGPSETHAATSYCIYGKDELNFDLPPIGKPISNVQVYILSSSLKPVPIGIIGEICISGVGLACGYVNKPELTMKKFVENPFIPGERLYRTGDLGRWRADGNIEFSGRIDDQVKIRGHRVECGEIEHFIVQHPFVIEAIVVVQKNDSGEKELISYIVCQKKLTVLELREFLLTKLPNYMVPSYFVDLKELPLTPNGKVDKSALPDLKDLGISIETGYVGPRNEIEKKLVVIWEEIIERERVGVHDDFFEIGGHSLRAVMIISRIKSVFQVEINLGILFLCSTISNLAEMINKLEKSVFTPINQIQDAEYYPLSHAQLRLWALDKFEKGSIAYNMPGAFMMEGALDVNALDTAFNKLIKRHEILRTRFVIIDDEPKQKVDVYSQVSIDVYDISRIKEQDNIIKDEAYKHAHQRFDLEKGTLVRVKVLKLKETRHLLLLNIHHIVCDGWSLSIFIKEFTALYVEVVSGVDADLPELLIQYRDYAAWHNQLLEDEKIDISRQYWLDKLSGDIGVVDLPLDFPRPLIQGFEGDRVNFVISGDDLRLLKMMARTGGASLFMGLLALVKILLYRYTGQEDVVVGTPSAGRLHDELDWQIGFYVNTLPLRDNLKGNETFNDILMRIKETVTNGFDNQVYPFDLLVEELELKRDISRSPLFDVMVVGQNRMDMEFQLPGVEVKFVELEYCISKFDLTFNFVEKAGEIECMVEYNNGLFKKTRIERLVSHFINLVRSVGFDKFIRLDEIDFLPDDEKNMVCDEFNATEKDYSCARTIPGLIERQVERCPNNIAVLFENRELTYRQLNEESNRLAHYLKEKFVITADDLVGVMLERSEYMIIALLGILKSGGAYVPIDPGYPEKRIEFMLEDSGCKVLITERGNKTGVKGFDGEVVDITNIEEERKIDLNLKIEPNSLAYVIYTSGSTGRPKGVAIEHENAAMFIGWCLEEFENDGFETVFAATSICFDLSVFEIFYTLSVGKKVKVLRSGLEIDKHIGMEKKILINTVPSNVKVLLNNNLFFDNVTSLNMAGEPIPLTLLDSLKDKGVSVRNLYGPSEDTTYTTYYKFDDYSQALIGKPIANTKIYIVDKKLGLRPVGVQGEICISGAGVARGYLNRPELTDVMFVENPFVADERLYHTGDLGRWLDDGNIEFFGRADAQVKVRGYRIECGEIEHLLMLHSLINEAVVVTKENKSGENGLVAYIVCNDSVTVSVIRGYLLNSLPDYMVPDYFVELERLPLTPNGKIDKNVLPDPEGLQLSTGIEYVEPHNEVEKRLAVIWEKLLGNEKVGLNDNFFELGGQSLKAIKLVSSIFAEFGKKISLHFFFREPTIYGNAKMINSLNSYGVSKIDNEYIVINEGNGRKLFCFPPSIGYSFIYNNLGQALSEYSLYGFHFIEDVDFIEKYAQTICELQPNEDIVLFGYSAGGNLAFNVAKKIERIGRHVSGIILLDSYKRAQKREHTDDAIVHEIEVYKKHPQFKEFITNEYFGDEVLQKIRKYSLYFTNNIDEGVVKANICLIRATNSVVRQCFETWENATTGNYKEIEGFGEHLSMLDGEALKRNEVVICDVLGGWGWD